MLTCTGYLILTALTPASVSDVTFNLLAAQACEVKTAGDVEMQLSGRVLEAGKQSV
jgi:hypothetical protein